MNGRRIERGRKARRRGRWAEALCRAALRLSGWRIVAAGHRSGVGEIDILARRGRVLAAVEVKARPDLATAGASVSAAQRRRIARAALRFRSARPDLAALDLRFDVMLVTPWRWPRHVPNAWLADPEW